MADTYSKLGIIIKFIINHFMNIQETLHIKQGKKILHAYGFFSSGNNK